MNVAPHRTREARRPGLVRRVLRVLLVVVFAGVAVAALVLGDAEIFIGVLAVLAVLALLGRALAGRERRLRLAGHRERDREKFERALAEGGPEAAAGEHHGKRHGGDDPERAAFGPKPPSFWRGGFPRGRL